jgi:hypothetical protein
MGNSKDADSLKSSALPKAGEQFFNCRLSQRQLKTKNFL